MGGDFISEIREIRGTGPATEPATDGIYHDITIKDTNEDGTLRPGAGIYGSMQVMNEAVGGVSANLDEISVVGNDLDGKDAEGVEYADGISKVATIANDLNSVESKVQAVIDNKVNIDTVAGETTNITTVSESITDVIAVSGKLTDIEDVLLQTTDISTVAADINAVTTTATNIANVNTTALNDADITTVATNVDTITAVADIQSDVTIVADNIASIEAASVYATDITAVVTDVIPNMDEILATPASANTATTKASEASASATIASDASTNASSSASIATAMKESAESSKDLAETAYNDTVAIYGDSTDVENAVNSATASTQTAADARDKASKWAEEDVDVEVDTGKYSSKHYNIKAEEHASNASISAGDAQTSANLAADSATASEDSKVAAEAAKDLTEQLHEDFRDAYLGYKVENPFTDNDGNELRVGALYFNTTSGSIKSWNGTSWTVVFFDRDGAMLDVNNLADLSSYSEARANLDVYSKAESDTITDDHKNDTANPHEVTKAQVGLGNCNDTSDADKNSAVATLENKVIDGGMF